MSDDLEDRIDEADRQAALHSALAALDRVRAAVDGPALNAPMHLACAHEALEPIRAALDGPSE